MTGRCAVRWMGWSDVGWRSARGTARSDGAVSRSAGSAGGGVRAGPRPRAANQAPSQGEPGPAAVEAECHGSLTEADRRFLDFLALVAVELARSDAGDG